MSGGQLNSASEVTVLGRAVPDLMRIPSSLSASHLTVVSTASGPVIVSGQPRLSASSISTISGTTTIGQQQLMTTVAQPQQLSTAGQNELLTAVSTASQQHQLMSAASSVGQQQLITAVSTSLPHQLLTAVSSAGQQLAGLGQPQLLTSVSSAGHQQLLTSISTAAGQQPQLLTVGGQQQLISGVNTVGQQQVLTSAQQLQTVNGQLQTINGQPLTAVTTNNGQVMLVPASFFKANGAINTGDLQQVVQCGNPGGLVNLAGNPGNLVVTSTPSSVVGLGGGCNVAFPGQQPHPPQPQQSQYQTLELRELVAVRSVPPGAFVLGGPPNVVTANGASADSQTEQKLGSQSQQAFQIKTEGDVAGAVNGTPINIANIQQQTANNGTVINNNNQPTRTLLITPNPHGGSSVVSPGSRNIIAEAMLNSGVVVVQPQFLGAATTAGNVQPGAAKTATKTKRKAGSGSNNKKVEVKCEVCSMTLTRMDHLKRHMATHTGVKPFKCQMCEQSFNRSDHLKRHMITHVDVKNYSCDLCSKTFSRSDRLKKHLVSHEVPSTSVQ